MSDFDYDELEQLVADRLGCPADQIRCLNRESSPYFAESKRDHLSFDIDLNPSCRAPKQDFEDQPEAAARRVALVLVSQARAAAEILEKRAEGLEWEEKADER